MAVAVKNTPEISSSSFLERLPVSILAGIAYVLGSLAVIFKLLPGLWWNWLGLQESSVSWSGLILLVLAAAAGLVWLGARLVGPKPQPGFRAGVFFGLLGVLLILLVLRGISIYFEQWAYNSSSKIAGVVLTSVFAAAILGTAAYYFLQSRFERWLVLIEEQGWFSSTSYKRNQGQRVRRGTILSILVLIGCGIYSLVAHHRLDSIGARDWAIDVPFTGRVLVDQDTVGDAGKVSGLLPGHADWPLVVDRYTLRDANNKLQEEYVKVSKPGLSDFERGQVVPKTEFNAAKTKLEEKPDKQAHEIPSAVEPQTASGATVYSTLVLLPDVKYTLPLVLAVVSLWFAWRAVNFPGFADFLIATEAELNKVSWTTRKRLVQDTIVVLVTVILLTLFLFFVDAAWIALFKWKPIGVLRSDSSEPTEMETKEQPW